MNRVLALLGGAAALPLVAVALWIAGAAGLSAVEARLEARFEGARFRLPSRIYARPLVLKPRTDVEWLELAAHLELLGYQSVARASVRSGEFFASPGEWRIGLRPVRNGEGASDDGLAVLRLDRRGRISQILDARGERRVELALEPVRIATRHGGGGEDRDPVRLHEVPAHLVEAILAVEDQRFFEHRGLDPRRMAGALAANLRSGRVVQGGSTLTQQLAKNLYLSPERSLARKLREALMALVIERNHHKLEILEAYLNEVYLGQRGALAVHGVGQAARHFFGKPVQELDLAEAALLAGLLRGPSLYSPFRNPEGARERRDRVLDLLRDQGRISEGAHNEAVARPLRLRPRRQPPRSVAYFVDFLRGPLSERFGAEVLERDGLAIHTTLDLRLQRIAQRSITHGLERLERGKEALRADDARLEAALVALDPQSGSILALVGGRDYARSQFNRATDAHRQPGSVFKPVVALAALARFGGRDPDFTLASVLEDVPLEIPAREGLWSPGNHDRSFRGEVTLREAVEESLNVPMARLGQEVGPRRIIAAARRLGIQSRLRAVPSLALGTHEVTLLEMTRAYAVLAAEGRRATLRATLRVTDREGAVREETPVDRVHAFDPEEVYLVTSTLEGVVNRGTGAALRGLGYRGAAAGKTGTTDDYRDAWFIGYTPEIVVGVWVGFDDGRTLAHSGSRAALPIFAEFLAGALGERGGARFRVPPGIERLRVVAEAGRPAGLRCNGAPEVFLSGTEPRESCGGAGWWIFGARERAGSEPADTAGSGRPVVRRRAEWEPLGRLGESPGGSPGAAGRERPGRKTQRGPRWKFPFPFGR